MRKDLYTSSRFKDFFLQDADTFFSPFDFARVHSINGHDVLCLFTSDKKTRFLSVDGENIPGKNFVLFVKKSDILNAKSGQSVNIDGQFFLISNAQDIQNNIWRIELTGELS